MSGCKFCKRDLDPITDGSDSDECDSCWYEMRLEPGRFERRMRKLGVKVADGGHGFAQLDDGSVVHFDRAPYRLASEPEPVNPTRAELHELVRRRKP